jgi:putative tryptophan/tyrosine transport system substrate-binding protein
MNRRSALRILGLACAAVAARLYAQQSDHVPVVGLLITHPPVTDKVVQTLRDGLRQYGYEDGRNVRLEVRTALGQLERVPGLARELVAFPSDVIVLVNEPALRAVRELTAAIPIVMVGYTDDPVTVGWIESYRRPGGNVTGIFNVNAALTGKRLEMLHEMLPKVIRVAVVWDPAFGRRQLEELKQGAELLRLQLQPIEVSAPEGIEAAFKTAKRGSAGAVILLWSPVFYLQRARIAALALQAGLPTIGELNVQAEAGWLFTYGSDAFFPFERAAYFVDRLLKGARAADLPVEQISRLKLVVNLRTAKALGIAIPQSILVRADEVIR